MASIFEEQADPVSRPPDVVYASFDELYACTLAAMVKLATFLVASRAEGEELTQDAFTELYRQWDTVENPAALLRTPVVRRCSRARERRFNEPRVLAIVGRDDPYVGVEAGSVDDTLAAVRRLKPERRS